MENSFCYFNKNLFDLRYRLMLKDAACVGYYIRTCLSRTGWGRKYLRMGSVLFIEVKPMFEFG